jgi:glycerophosphoryl diester phosphodiesterase
MNDRFELQGHRGARGLSPENTLPSFEVALDIGVSSIETDVHLTADGIPVLFHDPRISPHHCRLRPGLSAPNPEHRPLIATLTLEQLRSYDADLNPDDSRFPRQSAVVPPVARMCSERLDISPFVIPRLSDLFALVSDYCGDAGVQAGKTDLQRAQAEKVRLDLELKRVPFFPQAIGDQFEGTNASLFEVQVLSEIRVAGLLDRCRVRSFDHRSVKALKQIEPRIEVAILIAENAPVSPADIAHQAGATIYCSDYRFLDRVQVEQAHAAGMRVIPWTVNDVNEFQILLDWRVDGVTTDFPDLFANVLRGRGIPF